MIHAGSLVTLLALGLLALVLHAGSLVTLLTLSLLALVIHASGLVTLLTLSLLALVIHASSLVTLLTLSLLAFALLGGSLGLAVGALLVGRFVAGLAVLVVLALVLHILILVHAGGDINAARISRERFHLDAVGLLLNGSGNVGLGHQCAAGKSHCSESQ